MSMKQLLIGMILLTSVAACQSSKRMNTSDPKPTPQPVGQVVSPTVSPIIGGGPNANVRSPQVFVYKTKADYFYNVPVIMNNERTAITSYPAPTDLVYGGQLRLPTPLIDGWLLGNRGIGPNVAFLSYTYEEYAQMSTAPSMAELLSHIIEKYPLTAWHFCGPRADYTDIVPQLNQLIKDDFSTLPDNGIKLELE